MSKLQIRTSTYPDKVAAVRRDYEQVGLGYRRLCCKHQIPRTTIAYLVTTQKWVKFGAVRPSECSLSRADKPAPPADQRTPPLPPGPDRPAQMRAEIAKTATVIDFPHMAAQPRNRTCKIPVLPNRGRDDKPGHRRALAEIRATMTQAQIELLKQHEALLRRLSHIIEVYLEPERCVDLEGLNDGEQEEKIEATRALALRILLPTERDTLTGTIKTLTAALHANIDLTRKVAGLQGAKGAALNGRPGGRIDDDGVADSEENLMKKLSTQELRQVTQAMELLQRRQHEQREAPMPPLPEPIDDLFDPPNQLNKAAESETSPA